MIDEIESTDWEVIRDCCTSGNCTECRYVTPYGVPNRVIQGSNYSEAYANQVAQGWRRYNAVARRMQA